MLVNLPVYVDTHLFIEKGTTLTWKQIKDIFVEEFKEELEDRQVYLNIYCQDYTRFHVGTQSSHVWTLSYGLSHTQIQRLWHWLVPIRWIFPPLGWRNFNICIIYLSRWSTWTNFSMLPTTLWTLETSSNIGRWVKEMSRFRQTPNHVYKTKYLRKAYHFLIIFACRIYGQESTIFFCEGWVVLLQQLLKKMRRRSTGWTCWLIS